MREVLGEDTAADAEWLACHTGKQAIEAPTTDQMIDEAIDIPGDWFSLAKWKLVYALCSEHMPPVKVREAAFHPPVARIGRCARVRCVQSTAGRSSDRIYRLIVERLRQRVCQAEKQAGFETLAQRNLHAVVVGVSARIYIRDGGELLVWAQL